MEILTPLPKHYRRKYPFNQMEVNDTFLLPKTDKRIRRMASYHSKNGKKFIVRVYDHTDGLVYLACQRIS